MRGFVGVILALLGTVAVWVGAAGMFAEGVRADETQTPGEFSALDIIMVLGGAAAVLAGLSILFSWYAAKRSRD